MNKFVFYILSFVISAANLMAQVNLVPNGSFEDSINCPWSNDLGNGQLELAKGWWNPENSTSDYFHRCHSGGIVGVPDNFWGSQEPYHGDAYVGIVAADWFISNQEFAGFEYIETKLLETLKPCVQYYCSMYVSLAEVSEYGIGRIGFLFTEDSVSGSGLTPISGNPQIINSSQPIIDTAIWVKIEGLFTAIGNEKYITIGYFFDSVEDDTTHFQTLPIFPQEGYASYYIDSVSLFEIGEDEYCNIQLPNVFTPNGDNINDNFNVEILGGLQNVVVNILNRWGNVVYRLTNDNLIWNGVSQEGVSCVSGIYYYDYTGTTVLCTLKVGNGFIQLIR